MTDAPNHALQRTRPSRPGCNRTLSRAGSLSLGRWADTEPSRIQDEPRGGEWEKRV